MKYFRLLGLILLVSIIFSATKTYAEKRIAFVLGVQSYKKAPLANPINDARIIARAFVKVGFQVSRYTDLTYAGFRKRFSEFASQITPTSTVAFYFSGHGLQTNGVNVLIPLAMSNASQSINLNKVMATMERAKYGVKLVFIDACRSRPLTRSIETSIIKSAKVGLADMVRPIGTIISFATAPGKTASDGSGGNSPYTRALAENITTPGISINNVLGRTGLRVSQLTNNRQISWYNSSLVDDFYLNGRHPNTQVASVLTAPDQDESPENHQLLALRPIVALIRERKFDLSFKKTIDLATTDNQKAKMLLSTHYLKGWGTPINIPKAIHILSDVSIKGDPKAAFYLSKIYFKGLFKQKRSIRKGIKWLEIAARHGHKKAQGIVLKLKK